MLSTKNDQRETAVKRELLIPGPITLATTPATPACSLLSAEDASPAITSVSATQLRLDYETKIGFFPFVEVSPDKATQAYLVMRASRWSKRFLDQFADATGDYKKVLVVLGLTQACHIDRYMPVRTYCTEDVKNACLEYICKTYSVWWNSMYYNPHGNSHHDELIPSTIKATTLIENILKSKLSFLAAKTLVESKMHTRRLVRCHMLRTILTEIADLFIQKLTLTTETMDFLENQPKPNDDDDEKDKWNKETYQTLNWTDTLQNLMQDSFIQAECQSLFDIGVDVSLNEEGFRRTFENIKNYIAEQFGAGLKLCRDIIINVTVLLLLWYIVSKLSSTASSWGIMLLQFLSGMVVLFCCSTAAAVIAKTISQVIHYLLPEERLEHVPDYVYDDPARQNIEWKKFHERNQRLDEEAQHYNWQNGDSIPKSLPKFLPNDGLGQFDLRQDNLSYVKAEAQVSSPNERMAKIGGLLSLATIATLTGKDKWSADYFTKQIAMLPRYVSGLTSLVDIAQDCFRILHKEVLVDILGFQPLEDTAEHPQIERFNALMQLITEGDKGNLIQNSSVLQSYVLEAEQLGLKILQTPGLGEYRSAISTQYSLLRKLYERLGLRGVSSKGQRLAPIVIQLYGETGQGKSSIVTTLATKLLAKICDREGINKKNVNIKDLLYARNVEQEFWDGYHGQLVCVFDDFAQKRDFAQEPNPELFEIIRAGNTFPYALHMADISDKNTTSFQSRIIILTTNAKTPKIESLYAPEAFYRRVDLSFEVKIKPMFGESLRIGEKCVMQLAPEYKEDYDPSRQCFQPFQIATGRSTGPPVDLDDVVEKAFQQYNRRFNFEKSRQAYDQALAEELGFSRAEAQIWPLTQIKDKIVQLKESYYTTGEIEEVQQLKQGMQPYLDQMKLIKQRLQNKLKEHSTVLKALGILGVALSVCKIGSMLSGFIKPKLASRESAYAARPIVVRQSAYSGKLAKHRQAVKRATKATAEAYDQACRDVLISYAKRGLYHVSVDDHPFGNGFFITGKVFVMPRHFLTQMNMIYDGNENAIIKLTGLHTSYKMRVSDVDPINVFDDESAPDPSYVHDCVAFKFVTADNHRNMIHHFMSRDDQMKIEKVGVLLGKINYTANQVSTEYSSCRAEAVYRAKTSKECVYSEFQGEDEVERFYTRDFWRYAIPTTKGDCGSILAVNHPMAKAKLVGMHIMGIPNKDEGYSVALYQEDLEAVARLFQEVDTIEPPIPQLKSETQCLPFKGEFHPLGVSPTPFRQVTDSKIHKSELHPDNTETWREAVTRPTLLHPITVRKEDKIPLPEGERFDPFYYRLEKCGQPAKCVDQKILDLVKESYINELRDVCQKHKFPSYKSAYSFEEAVLGIDGDPYVNSINRSTSPGYGWEREGISGKKKWFGSGDEFDLSLAGPVKERCEKIFDLAKQGKRFPHVFIDTLKDERKPVDKWWKTRVFSACSMDYYIACKQYYQGIVGLLTRHRIDTGICVGINVYSTEWDQIVKHLYKCSPYMAAGDFENFDATLLLQVLEAARDVLNALGRDLEGFEEVHEKIRNVLFADLVNSIHLAKDILYQWTHSLPSGHYLTAIVNSIFVNLIFRYLLVVAAKETTYIKINALCRKLKVVSYGDDHVVSLLQELLEIFNQNTLPQLFADIGMIYTDEKKSGEHLPDYRPITDVTFLKRGFRWEPKLNRYVAPLSLDTVLETPFWFKKNVQERKTTEDNVTWSIQELALHDDEVFKFWTTKIRSVCKDVLNWMPDLSPNRVEYIQMLEENFDSVF